MVELFFLPSLFLPELFPAPLLRATPSAEPQEGGPVTLSCQTKLPLHRSTARLFFSFYKDSRTVRDRGFSSEFQIPTASEAHSGSYWCEAATEDNQVWKQSSKLEIRVQGKLVCICLECVKSEGKKDWTHEPAFGVSRLRKDTEEEGTIICGWKRAQLGNFSLTPWCTPHQTKTWASSTAAALCSLPELWELAGI